MSELNEIRDFFDLLERLCLELSNKKDWSAHQKAEKVKSFFLSQFKDRLEGELQNGPQGLS